MDILTEISDDYARRKGNALFSYLLHCVRRGSCQEIETELSNDEYQFYTKLIFNNELSFTYMVIQFLWPQIVRAAVEGGVSELEASGVYKIYIKKAKKVQSVPALLEMHNQVFQDYASKVSKTSTDQLNISLVQDCRNYVKQHLYEPLTVNRIAESLHYSRSHLTNVYKKEAGEMISDRIRKEKIKESKYLLQHTSLSLNDIGQNLAYSSQSHFTDVFRKETGLTPRQFRQQMKLPVCDIDF